MLISYFFGVADVGYESSFIRFLKPRLKLTFRYVQSLHSYFDSATPEILYTKLNRV
jgi:hypothetical protein